MYHQDVSEPGSAVHSGNFPVILRYHLFFILSVIIITEIFLYTFAKKATSNCIATSMSGPIS